MTKELWIQAVGPQPELHSVVPELTVRTSQGAVTVSLAELGGTVALVDPSQFSCYELAGSNLVKALDGPDIFPPIDPRTGIGVGYGNWATGGV